MRIGKSTVIKYRGNISLESLSSDITFIIANNKLNVTVHCMHTIVIIIVIIHGVNGPLGGDFRIDAKSLAKWH